MIFEPITFCIEELFIFFNDWGSEQNVLFCHNVSNEARPISCLRMQASVFYANVTVHLLSQERVSFLLLLRFQLLVTNL